ncbi:RING finger protein 212B-like [Asterias rubens]|uniref:RING finger protein 212B-like n=1 Tax=Asterias rubens TaxID=7604 RepID=UPI0014554469|nr:RING finger protein 212B-like [Asterias rubens]
MTDWVHCNTCFHRPGVDPRKFYLTSCGHIFCSECLNEKTTLQCPVCGNQCTIISLSEKLKPEVEIFFQEPVNILRKQQKQLVQVLEFQASHNKRLAAHNREKDSKMASMTQILKRQHGQATDMERELRRLQEENATLRRVLSGSGGTPKSVHSHRPGTPGRIMVSSSAPAPVHNLIHQSSSQPVGRTSSPYSPNRVHRHGDASSKTPSSQQPKSPNPVARTPPGPARYSIRGPPVNGRIDVLGTVGTPNTPHANMTLTPSGTLFRSANSLGGVMEISTPGRRSDSPMNVSPAASRYVWMDIDCDPFHFRLL